MSGTNEPRLSAVLPPVLPVGTAIVTLADLSVGPTRERVPAGSAALVVRAPVDPDHAYLVRFPGGQECALRRRELQVLAHFQSIVGADGAQRASALDEHDLRDCIILRCVVGSRAYGLDRDGSDTDRRGIYLPTAARHWSVYGVPEQLEDEATQECYWEIEKFIRLALKANPNVLETLYTPMVEHAAPAAQRLLDCRDIFLTRMVFQTFNGYAMSQFAKIEQDQRARGSVKWKHAMHLIRLLRSGIAALRTGELHVHAGPWRDELLHIRDGLMPWEQVDRLRRALHEDFAAAFSTSRLPERPDYARANELLVEARRDMARQDLALRSKA
jgi:hypothetical protein